jgi:hypothetical protein
MGLTMPAYGYYLERGRDRKDPKEPKKWNVKSEAALNSLFELLDHPLIKDIAIREKAVLPRFANDDLSRLNWRTGTFVEKEDDRYERKKLKLILEELQDQGTIVVPTIGHLKSNHELIKRLCDHSIAPISIDKVWVKSKDLKRALHHLPEGRPTLQFEEQVTEFFRWLTQSALSNYRLLETSRLRFPKENLKNVNRRKRTIKKRKVKKVDKAKKAKKSKELRRAQSERHDPQSNPR